MPLQLPAVLEFLHGTRYTMLNQNRHKWRAQSQQFSAPEYEPRPAGELAPMAQGSRGGQSSAPCSRGAAE
eukprot:13369039-Alexandrium_andersonii.AAC.1